MSGLFRQHLSREEIGRISAAIAAVESKTPGEIRVSRFRRRRWGERKLTLRDLALGEFQRLGMHKTRERTGVLILLLLAERKFQIIADEGIHARVPDGLWDRLAAQTSEHFKGGRFADGLAELIAAVGL